MPGRKWLICGTVDSTWNSLDLVAAGEIGKSVPRQNFVQRAALQSRELLFSISFGLAQLTFRLSPPVVLETPLCRFWLTFRGRLDVSWSVPNDRSVAVFLFLAYP